MCTYRRTHCHTDLCKPQELAYCKYYIYHLVIRLCRSFFFFFSSRRRHTRCSRDWSSDVCSSDLIERIHVCARGEQVAGDGIETATALQGQGAAEAGDHRVGQAFHQLVVLDVVSRSEERRVGKECRSRWSPYH